jgi:hypothetical protein
MGPAARRASALVRRAMEGADKETYLKRLLRHHNEKAITDPETWLRDEFDYLLSFYSILEIAALLGLIEVTRNSFFQEIRRTLEYPAVKRYYSLHYKLLLPQLFLRRLNGLGIPNEKLSDDTIALFYQFLPLIKVIENDKDVEVFLWFMDGGERLNTDYDDTIQTFKNIDRFAKCLSATRSKTPLDASVQGFAKFIRFCIEFDQLLSASSNYPILQAEMFSYNSYWFMQCSKKLGKSLIRGIEAIDETGGTLREEALPAVERLLSGKYGQFTTWFLNPAMKKNNQLQAASRPNLRN